MSEPKKTNTLLIVLGVLGTLLLSCCCVTGIGGYLARQSFIRFEALSRLAEPRAYLRSMAYSQEAHCSETTSYVTAAGPQPAVPRGTTRQMGDFDADPGFRAIGFGISEPVYFSYSVAPSSSLQGAVDLRAVGDADGDGETSMHVLTCQPAGCSCSRDIVSSGDPDERLDR